MYLTASERSALCAAATQGWLQLDDTIRQIREANPRAFHIEDSLRDRVFYDQPTLNEPHRYFVRPTPLETA